MTSIEEFRSAKDHVFAHDPASPLPAKDHTGFGGLAYYPPNRALIIEAQMEKPQAGGDLVMPTSTGDEVTYRRVGVVQFTVDHQRAQLTLFESAAEGDLFVPFRDATSGTETYAAGRYLEVHRPHGARVVLDFNYAYNPYCAYSDAYSCPLPPLENWLKVAIRAGEKQYTGGHGS